MQKIKQFILDVFFLLGDRLAIILVFIITGLLFFMQSSAQVFSQTQTPPVAADNEFASDVPPNINDPQVIEVPTDTPIPTPTLTPIPTETPTPSPTDTPVQTVDPSNDTVWDSVAQCESNAHWNDDTGNGYYGGLQFSQSAWESVGGSGNPAQSSREDQIAKAKLLQARRGWNAWGACAKKLGLD